MRTRARGLLAMIVLLALPSSGCVDAYLKDAGPGDADPTPVVDPYRVFIAADGDAGAQVTAVVLGVAVGTDGASVALPGGPIEVDLSDLSRTGQAMLIGEGAYEGRATFHSVSLQDVRIDGQLASAGVSWTVRHELTVTPLLETTLTLDLGSSVDNGTFAPVGHSLVAEEGGERVSAATQRDLEPERHAPPPPPPPLPAPEIAVEGPNGAFPSWPMQTALNLTVALPEDPERALDAFWFFPDGNTKQGLRVQHTFRSAGLHNVSVTVHGTRGEKVDASAIIEAWFVVDGSGEGLQAAPPERAVQQKGLDIPGENITSLTVLLNYTGAQQCLGPPVGCTPDDSEVSIHLLLPNGTEVANNTEPGRPKEVQVTGDLPAGKWTIEVRASSGASIGYQYRAEARYL